MKTNLRAGFSALGIGCTNPNPLLMRRSPPPLLIPRLPNTPLRVSVFRSSLPGNIVAREDVMQMFVKEREVSGDFITKASDMIWRRDGFRLADSEASSMQENIYAEEKTGEEDGIGRFLKLTKTKDWISGDNIAPVNKKLAAKDWQNDSEKRKQLNFLRYEALKRELFLVTIGIGAACTGYCLITLSVEAAISYALGVLCSCLYLQFLCHHTDNLSKEGVPQIFMHKNLKKIGIRSEDLEIMFKKVISGSSMALSSPRLIIPAAIYGFWALSNHFLNDYFDFQLVPGMAGFFVYKAGALVQVYRDNEDLRMVFPDTEDSSRNT